RRIDGGMGGETPGSATRITEDIYLAEDPASVWEMFQRLHPETTRLRAQIKALNRGELEDINRRIERQRLRIRENELRRDGQLGGAGAGDPIGWLPWALLGLAGLGTGAGAIALGRARGRVDFDRIPLVTLARNI